MWNFVWPLLNLVFELAPDAFMFSRICKELADSEGEPYFSYQLQSQEPYNFLPIIRDQCSLIGSQIIFWNPNTGIFVLIHTKQHLQQACSTTSRIHHNLISNPREVHIQQFCKTICAKQFPHKKSWISEFLHIIIIESILDTSFQNENSSTDHSLPSCRLPHSLGQKSNHPRSGHSLWRSAVTSLSICKSPPTNQKSLRSSDSPSSWLPTSC